MTDAIRRAIEAAYRPHFGPAPAMPREYYEQFLVRFLEALASEPTPEMVDAAGDAFWAMAQEHQPGDVAGAKRPFVRFLAAALSKAAEQVETTP